MDVLARVEAWSAPASARLDAMMEHLRAPRATDVLLFSLAHPRWECGFQPTYAPSLNLIEPWWQVWRSLALKGRRFETRVEVCEAVQEASVCWNAHRHPVIWGQRRRHRPRRRPRIGVLPKAA